MSKLSKHPIIKCLEVTIPKHPYCLKFNITKVYFIVYKYITFSDDLVVSCPWFVLSYNPLVTEGITETLYFATKAWPNIK